MKKIFTLLFSVAYLGALAQFTVTPNPVYISGATNGTLTGVAKFKNTSASDNEFTWVRTQSLPSGWTTQVCDAITCWNDLKDSSTFTLNPGDSCVLDVLFLPNSNNGNTIVKLFVFATGKRSQGDTVYYHAAPWPTSTGRLNPKEFNFYPNPARDVLNFRFESNSQVRIEIFNVIGNKVKTSMHSNYNSSVNIDDLPKGMYIIKVYENGRTITKTFTRN